MMDPVYYHDYDNEPIGGGNPYWRCVHCKRSDPEINGRLEGHDPDCAYRQMKEAALRMHTPGEPVADALSLAEATPKTNTWVQADARMRKHCQGKESTAGAALRILAAELRSKSN